MPKREKPQFTPPSPGETLKLRIVGKKEPGRITQEELADAMEVSRRTVNQIIKGKRAVTASMALRLSRVLGTSPEFWLDMQRDVDLFQARQELSGVLDELSALRRAPK